MSEPYKCGGCGGSVFRVNTIAPGYVVVKCNDLVSATCSRGVVATSVAAAFEAISKKD